MRTIVLEAESKTTDRQIFSVSELTRNIRLLLEQSFAGIWVEGEISNFKLHSSGHMYFCLKDAEAQLQCVMFRRENAGLKFTLEEGMKLLCFGRVSVYPVRGQYQLYVERLEPKGIGELQLRFEQLKEKLKKEGLFEEARKKKLPYLPAGIGIVTSGDGAALHDILNILKRRFATVPILICPVPVQGDGAAEAIAQAIRDLNTLKVCDVMIVGRGGGSLEDLWAFNEEIVARAIFDSGIPVVSAVGHEVDYTIADFVADLRAPTPSAAAELVVPLKEELQAELVELKTRATQATLGLLKDRKLELKNLRNNPILKNPLAIFEVEFQRVDELRRAVQKLVGTFLKSKKEAFLTLIGKLEALGPLSTLKRGFSASFKLPKEQVVSSYKDLKKGDRVKTRLNIGYFISRVEETHE